MQCYWMEQQYKAYEYRSLNLYKSIIPAALLYVSLRKIELVPPWQTMDYVRQLIQYPIHFPLSSLRMTYIYRMICN